jgi:hypothetical protein
MKNRIRIFCCLFMLNAFSMSFIQSQDLTGIWRGHFRSNDALERLTGNYDDRYKIEVQIAQTRNHFEAVTYSYKSTEFYGKAEATGSLNAQTKKVLLKEGKLLELRYASGGVCIMTCFMQYSKLGNDEYLQGTYYSTNVNDSTAGCGKGSIFLHRVTESDFHKEPFLEKKEKELIAHRKENGSGEKPAKSNPVTPPVKKTETAKLLPSNKEPIKKKPIQSPPAQAALAHKKSTQMVPEQSQNTRDSTIKIFPHSIPVTIPYVLTSRTNALLKTITVNNSDIELRIYDDGAIDNDSVSVYYDNILLISHVRLTDQPVTLHIKVEPSDQPHQLVMVAENLGDIPPNTSLLVVRDGEKRYEERIISTEQKNVQLNFIYKKIE